jgi:hypothetical protein
MTLTTLNDNQPDWVKPKLGLEEYKEFKLGQKVKVNDDWVYIIHIQKDKAEDVLFRGMLSNGASITMIYDSINKPVETVNEQSFKTKLIDFIDKNFMDESSSNITDSSIEDVRFTRLKNGFKMTAPTGKKFKIKTN